MPLKQDMESKKRRAMTIGASIGAVGLSAAIVGSCIGKDDNGEIRDDLAQNFGYSVVSENTHRTEDLRNYWRDTDSIAKELIEELQKPELLGVSIPELSKEEKSLIYLGSLLESDYVEDDVVWEVFQKVYGLEDKSLSETKDILGTSFLGSGYDKNDPEKTEEKFIELSNKVLEHELTEQQKKAITDDEVRRNTNLYQNEDKQVDISTIDVNAVKNAITSGFEQQEMLVEFEDGSVEVLRTNTK